jgi:hypothetical protein
LFSDCGGHKIVTATRHCMAGVLMNKDPDSTANSKPGSKKNQRAGADASTKKTGAKSNGVYGKFVQDSVEQRTSTKQQLTSTSQVKQVWNTFKSRTPSQKADAVVDRADKASIKSPAAGTKANERIFKVGEHNLNAEESHSGHPQQAHNFDKASTSTSASAQSSHKSERISEPAERTELSNATINSGAKRLGTLPPRNIETGENAQHPVESAPTHPIVPLRPDSPRSTKSPPTAPQETSVHTHKYPKSLADVSPGNSGTPCSSRPKTVEEKVVQAVPANTAVDADDYDQAHSGHPRPTKEIVLPDNTRREISIPLDDSTSALLTVSSRLADTRDASDRSIYHSITLMPDPRVDSRVDNQSLAEKLPSMNGCAPSNVQPTPGAIAANNLDDLSRSRSSDEVKQLPSDFRLLEGRLPQPQSIVGSEIALATISMSITDARAREIANSSSSGDPPDESSLPIVDRTRAYNKLERQDAIPFNTKAEREGLRTEDKMLCDDISRAIEKTSQQPPQQIDEARQDALSAPSNKARHDDIATHVDSTVGRSDITAHADGTGGHNDIAAPNHITAHADDTAGRNRIATNASERRQTSEVMCREPLTSCTNPPIERLGCRVMEIGQTGHAQTNQYVVSRSVGSHIDAFAVNTHLINQARSPQRRYILGAEIALAVLIASGGIASVKSDRQSKGDSSLDELDGELGERNRPQLESVKSISEFQTPTSPSRNESKDNTTSSDSCTENAIGDEQLTEPGYSSTYKSKPGAVLRRPTVLVEAHETLESIAEHHLKDGNLGWLIADLNRHNIKESFVNDMRIVELRTRQQLILPLWADIAEFYRQPQSTRRQNLITIVEESQLDRELLSTVLGSLTASGTIQIATKITHSTMSEVPLDQESETPSEPHSA